MPDDGHGCGSGSGFGGAGVCLGTGNGTTSAALWKLTSTACDVGPGSATCNRGCADTLLLSLLSPPRLVTRVHNPPLNGTLLMNNWPDPPHRCFRKHARNVLIIPLTDSGRPPHAALSPNQGSPSNPRSVPFATSPDPRQLMPSYKG